MGDYSLDWLLVFLGKPLQHLYDRHNTLRVPTSTTEAIPQLVIPGAQCGERHPEQAAAREGVMGQCGEGIEAFGLAANRLGQYLAGNMGVGHTVAAATLGIVDVISQPTHLR